MTLVIFDVDGTLVFSDRRDSQAFGQTYLEIYGKEFPSLDWNHFPHVTDHTIFGTAIRQQFDRSIRVGEIEAFQKQYLARLREKRVASPQHFKQVPGASEMVARLQSEARFGVAVATGGWKVPAEVKLDHIGIDPRELVLVGADNKTTREEILQSSIDQSQAVLPEINKVVYIGDAIWDVRTTRNMGLNFVGIRHRADVEVLKSQGASVVINNYLDQDHFLEMVESAKPPI
ncbi:MAG: HAD hydrolase-like protein [Saprospiraceae bacterium]